MQKSLLEILLENLSDPDTCFIFPTQIAAAAWAEKILSSLGSGTIAMERFIAWDAFKTDAIRSTHQDKKSIPALARKLFAADLIAKNSRLVAAGQEPLFRSLITPEYAQQADSYADWLAGLLPQLALWKKHRKAAAADPEDVDLERLYEEYRAFLEKVGRFEPVWEMPPFDARGNRYILFYPEALADFEEYRQLLSESSNITLVQADELRAAHEADGPEDSPFIRQYSNTREELHALALEIRRAHEEDGIPYEEMAVSVSEPEIMEAYLKRELELYAIPVNSRIARKLSKDGPGLLFSQISECVSTGFSFEAVKDLLLNKALPWKEPQLNLELIQFGIDNTCICPYDRNGLKHDPWNDAFRCAPHEELLSRFYQNLNICLTNIVMSDSFAAIKNHWFAFRNKFLLPQEFTPESDMILGRCIDELATLIQIEAQFPSLKCAQPFSFFTSYLSDVEYLPQSRDNPGVVLYPYKTAAAAPALRHFIPNASQKAVSVVFSRLLFLRQDKREQLGIDDIDASQTYLRLYAQNSGQPAWFSSGEKSLSGYTLPHSSMPSRQGVPSQAEDPVQQERDWLLQTGSSFPKTLSCQTKKGFAQWSSFAEELQSPDNALSGLYPPQLLMDGKIRVSESTLKKYTSCPRLWFYDYGLKIREVSLEADLMKDVTVGNVYHKIFELFFNAIQKSGKPLFAMDTPEVSAEYDGYLEEALKGGLQKEYGSPFARDILQNKENAFRQVASSCLAEIMSRFVGYAVSATEKEYTWSPDGADFIYTGRIDLELSTPDGQIILLDYKTGDPPAKKECFPDGDGQILSDFQFAMYTKLWEAAHPDQKVQECHFVNISKAEIKTIVGKSAKSPKSRSDLQESIDLLDRYAERFVQAVKEHRLDDSIVPQFSTCAGCNFRQICRTTYTVSGDTAIRKGGAVSFIEEDDNE